MRLYHSLFNFNHTTYHSKRVKNLKTQSEWLSDSSLRSA